MDGRVRWFFGLARNSGGYSLPIIGTPCEVPEPRKINEKAMWKMGGGLGGALEGLPNMAAKRSRYAQRFSTTDALVPLTPTLSLGEREAGRQRFRHAGTPGNVLSPASLLPLPEGEGGGEGEDDARPPATSDISQLSCRYTSPCLCSAGQAVESPPELRERPVDHKRSQSMGSSLPSAASRSSCFSLAASF